jgi:hypothetical protein
VQLLPTSWIFFPLAYSEVDLERAACLLGTAEALRENIHIPMREIERLEYDATVISLRDRLDEAAFDSAWAEGRSMDIERAIRYAVSPAGETGPSGDA